MEQVNDNNNQLHLIKKEEPSSPIYQCAKCDKQYKTKKSFIIH
jgi:hypothetical protein